MNIIKVSPSAIDTFFDCRRKFYLKYIENIFPKEEIIYPAMKLGKDIHSLFEGFNEQQCILEFVKAASADPTPEQIESARVNWFNNFEPKARAIYAAFKDFIKEPESKTEVKFITDFPAPEKAGFKWLLHGKVDIITKEGHPIDIKTTSQDEDWLKFSELKKVENQSLVYQYLCKKPLKYKCISTAKEIKQGKNETDQEYYVRLLSHYKSSEKQLKYEFIADNPNNAEEISLIQDEMAIALNCNLFSCNRKECKNAYKTCDYYDLCIMNNQEPYFKKEVSELFEDNRSICIMETGSKLIIDPLKEPMKAAEVVKPAEVEVKKDPEVKESKNVNEAPDKAEIKEAKEFLKLNHTAGLLPENASFEVQARIVEAYHLIESCGINISKPILDWIRLFTKVNEKYVIRGKEQAKEAAGFAISLIILSGVKPKDYQPIDESLIEPTVLKAIKEGKLKLKPGHDTHLLVMNKYIPDAIYRLFNIYKLKKEEEDLKEKIKEEKRKEQARS